MDLVEAVETMDGWYVLHDLRRIDWKSWKSASEEQRQKALEDFQQIIAKWNDVETRSEGSQAIYQGIGHKVDLMFMFLRPTMEGLTEIETEIDKSILGDFLIPSYSYFSIVELAKYQPETTDLDPELLPETQKRLKPILPRWNYMSFYPMSRRRQGDENWYTLEKDTRSKLLYDHSLTGRSYAGKVQQIITGSIGLDEFEWGVTLFAHDALQFKKIVYEMRFDEVTSRYGEFADFYIGHYLSEENLANYLSLS